MTERAALARLTLVFAIAAVAAWGAHRLLRPVGAPRALLEAGTFPQEGLRFVLVGSDLATLPEMTGRWPIYRGIRPALARAVAGAPKESPGAAASYASGWIAWTAGLQGTRASRWEALSTSGTGRAENPARPVEGVAIPGPGRTAIVLRPRQLVAAKAARFGALLEPMLPEAAVGEAGAAGGVLRETWSVECAHPCLFALLRPEGRDGVEAHGWSSLPADADAIAWFLLDPEAIGSDERGETPGVSAVERFLDMPIRATLAGALAGPVVVAVRDPLEDGIPRIVASFDLARPGDARAAVDRIFALGILAEAMEVARYRGVVVGTWRPRAASPLAVAAAVDGDVLLLASRPEDLRDALDRRRRAPGAGRSPRERLEGLGRGSWKAWSRSAFVASGWEEILSGRVAIPDRRHLEVRASASFEGGGWTFRSEGDAPLLAAEPFAPSARAVARALRREP